MPPLSAKHACLFVMTTTSAHRFQLLAPPGLWPVTQNRMKRSTESHHFYLGSLRQLRARAYFQDGAIQPCHLNAQSGYPMPDDERCWHFLLVDGHDQTIGCARYLVHPPEATYEQFRMAQSSLAQDPHWGTRLRQTAEATLQRARDEQVRYVELGGWALAEEYRNTKASLEIIVAPYLWAEMVGPCLFSCKATVRDRASSVLRRVGAQSLTHCGEPFPAYFDPQYNCTMEWLGFDSRQVHPRFDLLLDEMRRKIAQSPVLQPSHEGAPSPLPHLPAYRPPFRRSSLSARVPCSSSAERSYVNKRPN